MPGENLSTSLSATDNFTPVESGVVDTEPTRIEQQRQRRRLSVKQQLSLSVLVALVILSVILVVVVRPAWGRITALSQEIQQLATDLQALERKEARVKQADTAYTGIVADLPVIDAAVPTYSQVPAVMRVMEKIASEIIESGGALVINKITIAQMPNDLPTASESGSSNAKLLQRTPVEVSLSLHGTYESIRDYISQLRSQRHNYSLEKIVFFSSGNQETRFLDANLVLRYYYYE